MRERDEQRRKDIQAHRNVTYRQLFPLVKKRRKRLGLTSFGGGRIKKKTKPKKTSRPDCANSRRSATAQVHSRRSDKRKDLLKKLAVTHARIFRSSGEIKCRICGARLVEYIFLICIQFCSHKVWFHSGPLPSRDKGALSHGQKT